MAKYESAYKHALESHAIKIKIHGKFGAETLKTRSLLGNFFTGLANYVKAEEYLRSALTFNSDA
jgi:hypothetical protein